MRKAQTAADLVGGAPPPRRGTARQLTVYTEIAQVEPMNTSGAGSLLPVILMEYVAQSLQFKQAFSRFVLHASSLLHHKLTKQAWQDFKFVPGAVVGVAALKETRVEGADLDMDGGAKAGETPGARAVAMAVANYLVNEFDLGSRSQDNTFISGRLFSELEWAIVTSQGNTRELRSDFSVKEYVFRVASLYLPTILGPASLGVVSLLELQAQPELRCVAMEQARRDDLQEIYRQISMVDAARAKSVLAVIQKTSVPRIMLLSAKDVAENAGFVATQLSVDQFNMINDNFSRKDNYKTQYLVKSLTAEAVSVLQTPAVVPNPRKLLQDELALTLFLQPYGCVPRIDASKREEARIVAMLQRLGTPPDTIAWALNFDCMWKETLARLDMEVEAALAVEVRPGGGIVPAAAAAAADDTAAPALSSPAAGAVDDLQVEALVIAGTRGVVTII